MSKPQTPGPWKWVPKLPTNPAGWTMLIGTDPANDGWIAQGNDRTPVEPDGRLIAAAPVMLAALKHVYHAHTRGATSGWTISELVEVVEHAIAQAEGCDCEQCQRLDTL